MPKVIDVEKLFETTVSLFAERGYNGTTTQELAAAAGVSEVTLFRRFGSKAGLIEAAIVHCFSRVPFSQVEGCGDLRADLIAIMEAYQGTNDAYGGVVTTLLQELYEIRSMRSAILAPDSSNRRLGCQGRYKLKIT